MKRSTAKTTRFVGGGGALALGAALIVLALGTGDEAHEDEAHAHGEEVHAHGDEVHTHGDDAHADEGEAHTKDGGPGARSGHDHREEEAGAVRLTEAELAEFGIVRAVSGPGEIRSGVVLPGEVRANADRVAHIVPRYSGIALEVRAEIGDIVGQNEVLSVVESDESLAPFEVRTLMPGTVIAKHVALGEAVSRERDAFVVADLSRVWIDLSVYQRDLDRVAVGQLVDVYLGHERALVSGRIGYVSPVIDEATRTATARLVIDNREGRWRPGMFVTGRVYVDQRRVDVVVPPTAIHTLDSRDVVFVEGSGGWAPRSVEIGARSREAVEILSGLGPGETYAAEGGFTIKAELGKTSFSGHGHAH